MCFLKYLKNMHFLELEDGKDPIFLPNLDFSGVSTQSMVIFIKVDILVLEKKFLKQEQKVFWGSGVRDLVGWDNMY